MFERFASEARALAVAAQAQAQAAGAPAVEAEHLLLALARERGGLPATVLHSAGLDADAIRQALDSETAHSLSLVGVTVQGTPEASPATRAKRPPWATSAKTALERALEAAQQRGDRRIGSTHVLLGVLGAQEGRVPRALRLAGVASDELVAATHRALDADAG